VGHPYLPDAPRVVLALAPDFMSETWPGLAGALSIIVGAVGVGILLCGAYSTVVRLISRQVAGARGAITNPEQEAPGQPLTASLMVSLDFLIGAAIIQTLIATDWQHVTSLGGLVVVRAVAGLGFRWEAAGRLTCKEEAVAVRGPTPALEARHGVHSPPCVRDDSGESGTVTTG
jgi:uncharacterized membrane protein